MQTFLQSVEVYQKNHHQSSIRQRRRWPGRNKNRTNTLMLVKHLDNTSKACGMEQSYKAAMVETVIDALGWTRPKNVCLFVGYLTSQQQASVSQGQICSDNFTCCHTEIEVADPTFYLTQSQYTDTGPTSPSADPITPGAWQGSHWSANFEVTGMTRP